MLVNAGAFMAHSYKNSGQKATINYTKEIKNLVLPSVYVALSLLAWYFLPDLRSVLTFFVGSAIFLLLYKIYHFISNAYQCYKNKDKIYNENEAAIKALTVANPEKAISITNCHKQIDVIFKNLSQSIKDKFYESLMGLIVVDHQKAYSIAAWIRKIDNDFNEIRPHIRDRFFDPVINLAYTDRGDALIIATVVKEIDDIVSCIKNEALLNYFDKSFTFTKIQSIYERPKVIEFAEKCKEISEETPGEIQNFINRHTAESIPPEGIVEQAEVVNHLGMMDFLYKW